MRPRHIAYIIWTVIALLGVVCMVVPDGGWYIGKWNLRFPTLAEALDLKEDSMADVDLEILSDSLLAEADTVSVIPTDSLIQQDTLATQDSVPQKPQPVIPEVNVVHTDSRAVQCGVESCQVSARIGVYYIHFRDYGLRFLRNAILGG